MGKRKVIVVLVAACLGTFSTFSEYPLLADAKASLGSPRASINFADINMGDPDEEVLETSSESDTVIGPPGAKVSISDINLDSDEVEEKSLTTLQPLSLKEKETAPITELKPTLVPKAKSLELKPLSLNAINSFEEPAPITELAPTIVPKKGDFSRLNIMAAQEPSNKETVIDEEDRMIGSPRANTIIGQVRIDDGSDEIKSVIFKKSDGTAQENNYLQPLEAPKEVASIFTKEKEEKQDKQKTQSVKKESTVTSKSVVSTKATSVKDEPVKPKNQSQIKQDKITATEVKMPVEKERHKPVIDVKSEKVVNKAESNKMVEGSKTLDRTPIETQSQDTVQPQYDVYSDVTKESAPIKPISNNILESVDIISNIESNVLKEKVKETTVEQSDKLKEETQVKIENLEPEVSAEVDDKPLPSEVIPVEVVETKEETSPPQEKSIKEDNKTQLDQVLSSTQSPTESVEIVEKIPAKVVETEKESISVVPNVSDEMVTNEVEINAELVDTVALNEEKVEEKSDNKPSITSLTDEQILAVTAPIIATQELNRLKEAKAVVNTPSQNQVSNELDAKESLPPQESVQVSEEPKEIDATSYAIGISYGQGITKEFIEGYQLEIDRESMLKGVEDALSGKVTYTQEEMDKIFNDLNVQIQQNIEQNKLLQAELSKQKGDRFRSFYAKQNGVKQTSSGLLYRVILTGDSHTPTQESLVTVRYAGKLLDGTIFEQIVDPVQVPLSGLVPSWKEGLPKIGVGGRIELVVPPELGFGARETRGIPGNSTLIFEIELLDVQP